MQGFNMGRYRPPPESSPPPPPKRKARPSGGQTIRFEMPFAAWCAHCPTPTLIPQGVRFNAFKTRTGAYHTTPIYTFTFTHTTCGKPVSIRTDPQHTRYLIVSGARKQDKPGSSSNDDDESLVNTNPEYTFQTARERAEARETAFGKLEKTIADREKAKGAKERIDALQVDAERWENPYAQNQRLRAAFRVGRREREDEARRTGDLKERMSLGIDLLPGTAEDAARAAVVDFGVVTNTTTADDGDGDGDDDNGAVVLDRTVMARPLFDGKTVQDKKTMSTPPTRTKMLKSEIAAARVRDSLASTVLINTRATRDPFLQQPGMNKEGVGKEGGISRASSKRIQLGIKRRRSPEESPERHDEKAPHDESLPVSAPDQITKLPSQNVELQTERTSAPVTTKTAAAMVDYASDSD